MTLLFLGGCGLGPRSGPTASAILEPPAGSAAYDLVELTAATLPPFATDPRRIPTDPPSAAGTRYGVVPGDVLQVLIFERSDGGLFAPAAAGGTSFPAVRVDEDGAITLPYAGRIRVGGFGLGRVEAAIVGALRGVAIDPQVHVQLAAAPSHSVLVSGEVKTPGRVTTLDGPLGVVEAIARSGGPSQPAHMLDVVIHSAGGSRRLAYSDLLAQPWLRAGRGDQIIVEPNLKRFVAMGAVLKPGSIEMATPASSLLDGLAQAGGLNDRTASPSGVFLFRLPPRAAGQEQPRPTVVHLDFTRPDAPLLARQFALLPDDAIYVSTAPIWELQKFIAPFLQILLLGVAGATVTQ